MPVGEALSPKPRQRMTSGAPRLQSPTSPFFLGSNDDNLERAQARAARAAAVRRIHVAAAPSESQTSDSCFNRQQILELFQNCIKLASENKINQKNTWELNLIDHLCEVIKVEEESDTETNFQKASCTLEASVKIYSLRVDSVHSEAYKVLGGINRAGLETEHDATQEPETGTVEDDSKPKKDTERKISPLSTLEPSFEALNIKKFDVAFAVDPLYHQSTAQFDEGGAKGLLLNNLGVYGRCQVLFDSQEIPGKLVSQSGPHDKSETIDLSFAKEYVDEMVRNMQEKDEISPSLRAIVSQFDEDNKRPEDTYSCHQNFTNQVHIEDAVTHNDEIGILDDTFQNYGSYASDHEDQSGIVDEDLNTVEPSFGSYNEDVEPSPYDDPDMHESSDKVDEYLLLSLGFSSKQNAWAGPEHWKYRRAKGPQDHFAAENDSTMPAKKPRNKKQPEPEIDFTKALLDSEKSDIFAPPKNPKSLLLPANRAPCNTKLPEDCHYHPVNLVKLLLRPDLMIVGRRRRKFSDETRRPRDYFDAVQSWDNSDDGYDQFDTGNDATDVDDMNALVSQPRQVNKIEVQYDKTSKQVDVQVLKETLWDHIQNSPQTEDKEQGRRHSFRQLLNTFPSDCRAAPTMQDISPHLCFICLLHLANEHGLSISSCTDLDDLTIYVPSRDKH